MRISCSILQPVSVTDYKRFRFGQWEYVRARCLLKLFVSHREDFLPAPVSVGLQRYMTSKSASVKTSTI
jgi:hypothetical protein